MKVTMRLTAVVAAVVSLCHISSAQIVVNGGFEDTPWDNGWETNNVSAVSGIVGGSTTAAQVDTSLWQWNMGAGTQTQYDFAFQLDAIDGTQRIELRTDAGSGTYLLSFRVTGDGIQRYGGGWYTAIADETLAADTTYHLRVIQDDLDNDTLNEWTVGLSKDGGLNYDTSIEYQDNQFRQGGGLVSFEHVGFTGDITVDDVSITAIPEPATAGLLGISGIALYSLRRRFK